MNSTNQQRPFPDTAGPRIRVLTVTPRYAPYTGGIEHHVAEVARRLAQKNVDITVLTTDPSGKLPTTEHVQGVQIRRLKAWPAERDYYFAPGLLREITRGKWDLMHLQGYHTLVAPLAMLAARRVRLPYVVTFHGGGHSSRLRNAARGIQRMLLRPFLAHAERLVAVANFEIDLFAHALRVPRDRFVLIPNGADLPPAPESVNGSSQEGPLIASVGRLERYKGHQRVIAALPKVLEQQPNARLRIVGTGPYEAELHRQAQELGVANHIEIGGIPPDDRRGMATLLASAALVTLLSDYETHPLSVIEALALRRPVLVADTSGLSELAQQGLVRAVPLDSPPAFVAEAILGQLRDPLVPPPSSYQHGISAQLISSHSTKLLHGGRRANPNARSILPTNARGRRTARAHTWAGACSTWS